MLKATWCKEYNKRYTVDPSGECDVCRDRHEFDTEY